MTLATIVVAVLLISPPLDSAIRDAFHFLHPGQTQQESQSSSTADQESQSPSPPKTPPGKPCSEAQTTSNSQSGCKATSSKPRAKKTPSHKAAKSTDGSPSKTVVTNGGTGEPTLAISSEQGQRRAARVRDTNRLLDAADLNLKDVAVRGLTASQEVTVKQIRSYMDQAKAAENTGDVERAYTLANKANMLAADLNGH